YNWHADAAMFWSCWPEQPDRRDLLVIGAIRPSRTRCTEPYQPFSVSAGISACHDTQGRRLAFSSPIQEGQKLFFIGMLDRRAALPVDDAPHSGVEALYRQMQCLGLDEYHHMALDWEGADRISFPHLMLAPGELERVRANFQHWDWLRERCEAHVDDRLFLTHDQPDMRIRPEARTLGSDWAGAYLVSGQSEYASHAKDLIAQRLDRWVECLAALGPTEDELIGISLARLWRSTCIAFDMIAASDVLTAAERLSFLRKFAFVAEVASTPDAWPAPESGLERGNPNFHADYFTAKGISAALLAGHPKQGEWLDYAATEAVHFLRNYHFPSGCAGEAATYQFVSLACMTLLSIALQHSGRADLFTLEPSMQRSFDFLAASQTPRDPRSGFCMLPTVGHVTSYGWCQSLQACFAWAAKATAMSDPAFSQRMMAAWRRAGAPPISLHEFHSDSIWWQPACLIDRALPVAPDPAQQPSRLHEGLGAIFRTGHPGGGDGYLLVKMGPSRGHFDPDEGSLIWYAYGQPLLLDFGCQYNPNIECAWLHNRVSIGHWNEDGGNHFRVLNASLGARVDFICGEMVVSRQYRWGEWPIRATDFDFRLSAQRRVITPVTWRRQVLYVHACEAVLLLDELAGAEPSDWNLQVLADEARLTTHSAHFTGPSGVNLDVYLAQPQAPDLALSAFEHLGFDEPRLPFYWWKAAQWAAPEGARYGPLGERALTFRARAAPGQGYLALLPAHRGHSLCHRLAGWRRFRVERWWHAMAGDAPPGSRRHGMACDVPGRCRTLERTGGNSILTCCV
ncbi:MAG: hypothetical protein M1546_02820, partial [Chloroflexi bacterium]|nr:hypothetical protein [Chloroflexota bacterium]